MTRRLAHAFAMLMIVMTAMLAPTVWASMPAVSFPHEHSPIKPDPAARYGRLPNGFTYIIQKNTTPSGTARIYMRVGVGAMMESDTQKGYAHFVEHMAFDGSTHIPPGELKKILQRHGFSFGADANAFTSDSRTVYVLGAPKADADTLTSALFILREVAGNLSFDPAITDTERGVVLSEERVRDTPERHRAHALDQSLFTGQRAADHLSAIGTREIVGSASAQDLATFYHTWYRPEFTTLIIVGDIDPDAVEADIKAKFSDWQGVGTPPDEPVWGAYQPKGVQTFGYTEKGLGQAMVLQWVKPYAAQPDTPEREISDAQDRILCMLMSRRLLNLSRDPNATFVAAALSSAPTFRTGQVLSLLIAPKPGKAKAAFEQTYGALHTFVTGGVTEEEVTRVLTDSQTTLKNMPERLTTRDSDALAADLLSGLENDTVQKGPDDTVTAYKTELAHMTQAELNARLQILMNGDGPMLARWGQDITAFDQAAMKDAYTRITARTGDVYKAPAIKPWPYTDFGLPAVPVSHSQDKDFGFTRYVFPNGVVLNVKPTSFRAKQVLVEVSFLGGIKSLDPKDGKAMPFAQSKLFVPGGLGKLTANEINEALAGKQYSASYALRDGRTVLAGQTTPDDLRTQMDVLMAYATDPGLRSEPFDTSKALLKSAAKSPQANPSTVLSKNLKHILSPGDDRFDLTIFDHSEDVRFGDVRQVFLDSLKDTPISITIVGDVDEAAAVAEVGRTFATLPQRPAQTRVFPGADKLNLSPTNRDVTLPHDGRVDQNISEIIWPTTDFYRDTQTARGLQVLAGLIRNRLTDALRGQGVDYSPFAEAYADDDFAGYGYIRVHASVASGNDGQFRAALKQIADDLKTQPVSADELARVVTPILDKQAPTKQLNAYWVAMIPTLDMYPQARASVLNQTAQFTTVTPAQIMDLAKTWLHDDTAIHIEVVPRPSTAVLAH